MKYYLLLFFGFLFVPSMAQDEPDSEVPFDIIDKVPIYPGCENYKNNLELKNCMSQKINRHIIENYNISFTRNLELEGRQRIEVLFTVDSQGNVVDIKAKGPHPFLEDEAKRTVQSIPQMTPGEHKGEAVAVLYSLPIIFDIESDEEE